MKKRHLALLFYAVALAIDFYLLPLTIENTGMGMLMLLLVIPLLSFACALLYGVRQGFDLLLPIITAVLFAPTIFIFYNSSAWIYIIVYTVVSFVGNSIGRIFYKKG